MTSSEIREKYLKFFEERDHKRIDPAPLVPEDGTTLFVTAGMQPLVPYLLGKEHPEGKRLVDIQPCLRTDDIEEVGDNTHNTFLEMMGNWSLGDYWKKESLEWSLEFLTQELNLPKEKLAVTVFAGNSDTPRDDESIEIWKSLGIPGDRIFPLGKEDNWWGPVGETGPCGPDSEIFYWTGEGAPKDSPDTNPLWVEVWNNVFMEYNKTTEGNFEPLKQRNVDTGIGMERTTTVVQGKTNVYDTDLFIGAKEVLGDVENKAARIIIDHIRAAIFIIDSGITPSNKEHGYILRRLIRRAAVYARTANINLGSTLSELIKEFKKVYKGIYLDNESVNFSGIISEELNKFDETLERGLKEITKTQDINERAFDLYQTYGFPLELTEELAVQKGLAVDREQFYREFEKHKSLSRTASDGIFKGGLASSGETETKYHTATHLLHAALRQVLGDQVIQRGSNITSERLRFDFSHTEKLTDEQIKEVEKLVNQKIEENLPVTFKEMSREEAEKTGAIHAFGEKYGDRVKVYSIGPTSREASRSKPFSLEFCGGPHVENTRSIGHVKITKEESAGAGIRRIYAEIV